MTEPKTIFRNNKEAAHSIRDFLGDNRMSVRPFNRFNPEFSEWWIFRLHKGKAWPAYPYSKFFFYNYRTSVRESPLLFTGFYIERGFGSKVAGLPGVNPTHVMKPDWQWQTVLEMGGTDQFKGPMEVTMRRTTRPLILSLTTYEFNHPPRLNEERPPYDDRIEFVQLQPGHPLESLKMAKSTLDPLNGCDTAKAICRGLLAHEQLDFFWVDFLIGTELNYGIQAEGGWTSEEVWENCLEPWSEFVVELPKGAG